MEDRATIQEIIEKEGGTFIGIQGSFDGEEDLVLFIFPESTSPHAIPLSKFSSAKVRVRRPRNASREENASTKIESNL